MICRFRAFTWFYTSDESQPEHPLKCSGSLRDKQESTTDSTRQSKLKDLSTAVDAGPCRANDQCELA